MIEKKKQILALIVALTLTVGGAEAQIFNNGTGESNNRLGSGSSIFGTIDGFGNINIGNGFINDDGTEGSGHLNLNDGINGGGFDTEGFGEQEISPVGSGLFLLMGLAGAYGLTRRKKQGKQ